MADVSKQERARIDAIQMAEAWRFAARFLFNKDRAEVELLATGTALGLQAAERKMMALEERLRVLEDQRRC